ncbi:MAG: NADPH-dependent assimilatory sulfite reductase hemoprotein subunit [Zetaproteobacteria bacterium]|nr:MAG: NADPH-dependent assimilatory sulfite reductase hemoprotein subunit [Zetaproteobacteria bacterium]
MSDKLSANEGMKTGSRGLRGTLSEGIANQITGALNEEEQQLVKFHGSYQQDDRDRRAERERKKLEWAYSYMIRLRISGGDLTAHQWLKLQESCDKNATGIIKITTRQTIQFHGIVKARMKPTMKDFDVLGLDSIAACGDVNRNVMCGANPALVPYHAEMFEYADKISLHLLPKTGAFREVWLDGKKLAEGAPAEEDPLYKDHYLPRKFKIAIAVPPHNENDVFANDIGLIAIGEGEEFLGFNIAIGGGLGATHGNNATYPRRGTMIGFIPKDKTLDTLWQIIAIQRDHGNREDRKLSRLKYTVDKLGVEWFKEEIEKRCEFKLEEAKPYEFDYRGDAFGWVEDYQGKWHYGIFVENGLVRDIDGYNIKSALLEVAETDKCGIRFTGNQNMMLTYVDAKDKDTLDAILLKHGIIHDQYSKSRKEAIACVAMPTCPLALAEGQRYLPELITKIDALQDKHGLKETPITIRMTGCPNGCGRPYLAEIGFVGKAAGKYALRLGGDYEGERLNQVYTEEADEVEILETLDTLFGEFVGKRSEGERFGDYIHRTHFKGQIFIGSNQEINA